MGREVYRPGWEGLTDRGLVDSGLALLVTHGYLSEAETGGMGRPTMVYSVLHGARS